MAKKVKCPKCGYVEQPTPSGKCYKCGFKVAGKALKEEGQRAGEMGLLEALRDITKGISSRMSFASTGGQGLPDFWVFFERTWETYKRRFIILFSLFFVSVVIASAGHTFYWTAALHFWGSATLGGETIEPATRLTAIAGIISLLVLAFWSQAAFIFAVCDESGGIKGAVVRGFRRLGSYVLIFIVLSFITVFVTMAVMMFFMLLGILVRSVLFFLPEIIFLPLFGLSVFLAICVWFAFAFFVLVVFAAEDRGAIDALSRSLGYLKGAWFAIIKRVLFIPVTLFIANIPVAYLLYETATTSVDYPGLVYKLIYAADAAAVLINSIIVPFFAIFVYKLYEEIRTLKGATP